MRVAMPETAAVSTHLNLQLPVLQGRNKDTPLETAAGESPLEKQVNAEPMQHGPAEDGRRL